MPGAERARRRDHRGRVHERRAALRREPEALDDRPLRGEVAGVPGADDDPRVRAVGERLDRAEHAACPRRRCPSAPDRRRGSRAGPTRRVVRRVDRAHGLGGLAAEAAGPDQDEGLRGRSDALPCPPPPPQHAADPPVHGGQHERLQVGADGGTGLACATAGPSTRRGAGPGRRPRAKATSSAIGVSSMRRRSYARHARQSASFASLPVGPPAQPAGVRDLGAVRVEQRVERRLALLEVDDRHALGGHLRAVRCGSRPGRPRARYATSLRVAKRIHISRSPVWGSDGQVAADRLLDGGADDDLGRRDDRVAEPADRARASRGRSRPSCPPAPCAPRAGRGRR